MYTQSTATRYNHDAGDRAAATITIDISEVDEDAARWWAAVLAPDQGWKAVVSQGDNEVHLSPWSVCVEDEQSIGLDWQTNPLLSQDSTGSAPPSSKKAFELLTGFCLLHDLGSQFFAALATVLTFPTHNHYGIVAKLPFPTNTRGLGEHTPAKFPMPDSAKLGEELPYYMALSCNHNVIVSSLCGVFWEPNVPCNLVSPWLHPVMNEVPIMEEIKSFKGRYEEILAIMCALRRPKLSALWLGAVISGLAPTVLNFIRSGTPPLDPNAFAWTGCAQSFMDLAGSGPYSWTEAAGEKLQKADAWRLLFLPTVVDDDLHYESYPFAPWKPIGTTSVQNSVARIRIHMSCSRHHLDYQHWTWQLGDGSTLDNEGFEMKPFKPFHKKLVRRLRGQRVQSVPLWHFRSIRKRPGKHHGRFFTGSQQIAKGCLAPSQFTRMSGCVTMPLVKHQAHQKILKQIAFLDCLARQVLQLMAIRWVQPRILQHYLVFPHPEHTIFSSRLNY